MTRSSVVVEGLLELDLIRGRGDRTRIAASTQRFPQRITAPMYLDEEDPGMAFLCVQNPTGGVFPGDRLHTAVTVRPRARLHLTAQSATQVYSGGAPAQHDYRFEVHDGALVEHFPKTTIPHKSAHLIQSTRIDMLGDSVFIGFDTMAAGRIGHGERFEYGSLRADTTVSVDGTLRSFDALRLEPRERDPGGYGRLAGHDYLATLLVLAPKRSLQPLAATFNNTLRRSPGAIGAASTLPDAIGVSVRFLSDRAPTVHNIFLDLWSDARRILLSRRLPTVRM